MVFWQFRKAKGLRNYYFIYSSEAEKLKMTKPKVITLSIIGLYAKLFCDFLVEKVVHFNTQCDYALADYIFYY